MRPRSLRELRKYRAQRLALIEQLGGKCVICGFSDWRALQFDHIDGGGYTRGARGRPTYLVEELKLGRLQLLCANCNQIKRYTKGENVVLTTNSASETKTAAHYLDDGRRGRLVS